MGSRFHGGPATAPSPGQGLWGGVLRLALVLSGALAQSRRAKGCVRRTALLGPAVPPGFDPRSRLVDVRAGCGRLGVGSSLGRVGAGVLRRALPVLVRRRVLGRARLGDRRLDHTAIGGSRLGRDRPPVRLGAPDHPVRRGFPNTGPDGSSYPWETSSCWAAWRSR